MAEVLVMYKDEDGLPRAYASGPPEQQGAIEDLAYKQLMLYLTKKRMEGISSPEDFRKEIILF